MSKGKEFAFMLRNFTLRQHKDFYHLSCPSCKEPIGRSGVYLPTKSRYWCYQPGCRYSKSMRPKGTWIVEFIQDYKRLPSLSHAADRLNEELEVSFNTPIVIHAKQSEMQLPSGCRSLFFPGAMADRARKTLISRGYDLERLNDKFSVMLGMQDESFGYFVFPFFDIYGRIVYYQMRAYHPLAGTRWKNPVLPKSGILYNESALLLKEPLFVCEGVTDTLTMEGVGQLGLVASGTDKISHSLSDDLVCMLDGGAWLECLTLAYSLCQLSDKRVWAVPLPDGQDPNSLGKEKCYNLTESAGILITPSEYVSELSRVRRVKTKTFRSETKNKIW